MRKGILAVCLSVIFVIVGVVGAFGQPDANKKWTTDPQDGDDKMCWAAAAANILTSEGWDNKYGDAQTLFDEGFVKPWTNEGGLMKYAWQWWFQGTTNPPSCAGWATFNSGYAHWPNKNFFEYYRGYWKSDVMEVIKYFLGRGYGVTIAIYKIYHRGEGIDDEIHNIYEGGHAITVVDYKANANGTITGLKVTDSDCGQSGCGPNFPDPNGFSRWRSVKYDGSKWRVKYSGSEWMIEGVQALKPQELPKDAIKEDPEIEAASTITDDIKFAIVKKKCFIIGEDHTEKKEIPCSDGLSGTVIFGDQTCDSECTRLVVPFSTEHDRNGLTVQVILDEVEFKLTEPALDRLMGERNKENEVIIPPEVHKKLKEWIDEPGYKKRADMSKDVFLKELEKQIGKEASEEYGPLILEHANNVQFLRWEPQKSSNTFEIIGDPTEEGGGTFIGTDDCCPVPVIGCSHNG